MNIKERLYDPRLAMKLKAEGLPNVLAQLYASRGVTSRSEAEPSLSAVPPVSQLKNCTKLAETLAECIEKGNKILVVADYDADGATGCTVAVRALKAFKADVDYIIPHRVDHGYGLTEEVARMAIERKPDVVLTVDNGISSHAGIELCMTHGIRVFVTDHHLPGDTLPPAEIIVNPSQPGETFPTRELAGVGVMFYVMRALREVLIRKGKADSDLMKVSELLPIVAVGTIADVVPLGLLNRVLVGEGLARIRVGRGFPAITALAEISKCKLGRITAQDIGFMVAPRINAAGRLSHMNTGVSALLTDNVAEANALAEKLDSINQERKKVELHAVEEAATKIAETLSVEPDRWVIVAGSADWHPGVVGIVAGRLKEAHYRPTVIFAIDEKGNNKGSARSIPGLHIRDAFDLVDKEIPGLILKFGGHAMAAGISIAPGRLEEFASAFETVVRRLLKEEDLAKEILVDGEISSEELTEDFADMLDQRVWGSGFPPPLFMGEFEILKQDLLKDKITGEEKHSRLWMKQGGKMFTGIKFNCIAPLPSHIQVAYVPSLNIWNDKRSVQIRIEHIVGF